jgi:hypothetical protein
MSVLVLALLVWVICSGVEGTGRRVCERLWGGADKNTGGTSRNGIGWRWTEVATGQLGRRRIEQQLTRRARGDGAQEEAADGVGWK